MTGGQRVSRSLPREEFLHEASGTCFAVFVHVPHSHCFVPTSLRSHSIFAPEWPEKKGNSHQCQMPRKAGFRSITISPRLSMSAFPPHRKPKFGVGLRYPLHSTAAEHLACSRRNQQRWPVSSHGSHSQWGMSTETGSTACTLQPEKGNARFDGPGYPPPPSCRSLYELCCDTLICGDSAVIALFQVYMTFPPLPGAVIPSTCQGTPIGSTAAAGKYTKAPFPSADAKRLSSDTQGGGRRRASKRMTAKKGLGGVLVVLDRFLYIFAFIFPQRTCFGSNNRRWKGFGFFVGFRFCWYFLPVVLSLGLVYVFSSFYLACTSTRARKTKVATAPDHFFLASFTDHKKKEYVLESFILGRPHC